MDDVFWIQFSLLAIGAVAIFTVLVVLLILLLDYLIKRDRIEMNYNRKRNRSNRDDRFFENVKEVQSDFEGRTESS